MKYIFFLFLTILFLTYYSKILANDIWLPTNGPFGGTINTTIIDKNDYIYVGSGVGIFQSKDYGENWENINNGFNLKNIIGLATTTKGEIYSVTRNGLVYYSYNEGKGWIRMDSLKNDLRYITANEKGDLFILDDGELYLSILKGTSWKKIFGDQYNMFINTIAFNSKGNIYAMTSSSLSRSTDNGESWTTFQNVELKMPLEGLTINDKDYIFIISLDGHLLRSTDNGENWTVKLKAVPNGDRFLLNFKNDI